MERVRSGSEGGGGGESRGRSETFRANFYFELRSLSSVTL